MSQERPREPLVALCASEGDVARAGDVVRDATDDGRRFARRDADDGRRTTDDDGRRRRTGDGRRTTAGDGRRATGDGRTRRAARRDARAMEFERARRRGGRVHTRPSRVGVCVRYEPSSSHRIASHRIASHRIARASNDVATAWRASSSSKMYVSVIERAFVDAFVAIARAPSVERAIGRTCRTVASLGR